MKKMVLLMLLLIFLCPGSAGAYVGPGLGLGTLGVILGVLASIFFAIVSIFYYPIKRIFRKFRKKKRREDV